jgi:hypothetical protein
VGDDLSVEALLERAATLNLKEVIVIGEDPDGGGYLASTATDPDDVLAYLVSALIMLSITCFAEKEQSFH